MVQVAGYCEKVAALQDRRTGLYHSLEEALLKLKANKDVQSFQNTLKRIGGQNCLFNLNFSPIVPSHYPGDQKVETVAVCELQVTIRGLSCELGERVGELQRLDKLYRELQTQQVRTEIVTAMMA